MTSKTRKSNFRNTVAVLAVSVLALAGLGGSTASAAQPATKVVIKPESGGFYGFLKSTKLQCKSERTVVLYEQLGAKPKPRTDLRVGMDTSGTAENGYEWNMGNPGLESGRYYARAVAAPGCPGVNSVTLRAQR